MQGGVLYAAVLQTALHLVLHEAVTAAEVGQPHRALLIHGRLISSMEGVV
jgi:hypothetical protein